MAAAAADAPSSSRRSPASARMDLRLAGTFQLEHAGWRGQIRLRGKHAHSVHSAVEKSLAAGLFALDTTVPVPRMVSLLDHWDILGAEDGLVARADAPLLFVTRGLGNALVPWRFHCPPEIAFIRLRRG